MSLVSLVPVLLAVAPAQSSPPVTIDAPVGGQTTARRTLTIAVRAPVAPRGGATLTTVVVNGRRITAEDEDGGGFRVRAALDLGTNTIAATAEVFTAEDEDFANPQTFSSEAVQIDRRPGPRDGVLDFATADWVSQSHSDVYWLCGEGDGCRVQPSCVRVSGRRIDCPMRLRTQDGEPTRCGVVVVVQLRAARNVHSYSYRCEGRWPRGTNSRRFVRPRYERVGTRYRVDVEDAPWLAEEINSPNRYGVPRFDVNRDEFIP